MMISKKTFFVTLMAFGSLLAFSVGPALAVSSYLNAFNGQYGTSRTNLDSCSLCHPSVPDLNGYGSDYNGSFTNIQGLDSDGDGFTNIDEINARTLPGDASSFPETLPVCTDNDGDGFAIEGLDCGAIDCDDSAAAVNPSAQEICTDSIDNNCNGLIDNQDPQAINCPPVCTDVDGDGYAIEGGNCGQVDCNDNAAAVNPGATENCSDSLDNDCDSLIDSADPDAVNCPVDPPPAPSCTDDDLDGFALEGGECGLVDCNDADPAIHPDAVETCTDGTDNNCDGLVDLADPNAVGCPVACTDLDLDGYAVEGGDCGPIDCNDLDELINPAATEECSDAIDNDCNDLIDTADPNVVNCPTDCTDLDGDGYAINGDACGQVDCSDSDSSVNPGASEICGDGIDQDCNGSDQSCAPVLSAPSMSLNVSGLDLSINWTPVADATGYKLSYAPYPYTDSQSIVSLDLGDVTSFSYELWEGAAFNVAVQAYSDESISRYSNIENFIIEETDNDGSIPASPTISLTVTGTNLLIHWAAVDSATGYTLFYASHPSSGSQSFSSLDLGDATSFSYDLWPGAAFNVYVQAYNEYGRSERSNVELFVTDSPAGDETDSVEEPVDGAALYANSCAACHGALERSDVGGEDAGDIEEAISDNEGGMGFLEFLTDAQIRSIANVLSHLDEEDDGHDDD